MVGYNLRLHAPVRRLVDLVHAGRAGRACRRCGSGSGAGCPTGGRPSTTARPTRPGPTSAAACCFDAIHELDMLVWLLGVEPFDVVGAVVDRLGPLEIDVEDTVKAVLRHPSGVVAEVSLDYLSRRYRRGIEVVGDRATVRLDWARVGARGRGRRRDRGAAGRRSRWPRPTRRQAARFLAFVAGDAEPPVDGATGGGVGPAGRGRSAAPGVGGAGEHPRRRPGPRRLHPAARARC